MAGLKPRPALLRSRQHRPRLGVSLMVVVLIVACSRDLGPSKPLVQGPMSCTTGVWYNFSATSTHPLGDNVCFQFDWAGQVEEFGYFVRSGEPFVELHSFDKAGSFQVRARSRDSSWRVSAWSSPLVVTVSGSPDTGGPPTGVAVSAGPGESDSTVLVNWTTPAEGSPDNYVIYFRSIADTSFQKVGVATATSYCHNPHGATGWYEVSAVFDGDTYRSTEMATTVPVQTDVTALFEINADSSRCAFGCTRDSGVGRVYAMTESANCAHVDFYVSDLQTGVGGPLDIVSPNKADSTDPGAVGLVPSAAWLTRSFSNPLLDPQRPLPAYQRPPNANYFIYTQISSEPCYIGCYTVGDTVKHYALIQVDSFDVASGRIWMKSWYQLVPGLRLIQH